MVLSKRVGTILKEAREERKLSVKEVGRETNITPKYIDALENEDYAQFPGETYLLGFLRSYSEYLNLDTDHLLNLYRGHQIDLSEAPLKELTKPTSSIGVSFRMPEVPPALLAAIAGFAVVAGIVALFVTGTLSLPSFSSGSTASNQDSYCSDREIVSTTLPQAGTEPKREDLNTFKALRFNADSVSLKFCLARIVRNPEEAPRGVFHVRVNDETNYELSVSEGEQATLSSDIRGFEGLQREIYITPVVISENSARVALETAGVEVAVNPEVDPPRTAGEIQVRLQFISDSYLAWVTDGTSHRPRNVPAGESRSLEAENRLEIRLGNGGGVKIYREGAPTRVAGPPSKIVDIEYRRVPDPLDPSRYVIQESIKVAH